MTREQKTALLAITLGLLVGALTTHVGGGVGDVIGAAFLTYAATVIAITVKTPVNLAKVVAATGRGSIIAAVVIVLLLTSIGRSLASVISG